MRNWRLILSGLLLILLLVAIVQNSEPVQTRFLVWSMVMPQAALLAITALFGGLAGLLIALRISSRKPLSKSPKKG